MEGVCTWAGWAGERTQREVSPRLSLGEHRSLRGAPVRDRSGLFGMKRMRDNALTYGTPIAC